MDGESGENGNRGRNAGNNLLCNANTSNLPATKTVNQISSLRAAGIAIMTVRRRGGGRGLECDVLMSFI